MGQLWKNCVIATSDPAFGLTVAKHAFPAMLHSLGPSCVMSQSVKDAIIRLGKYSNVVSDVIKLKIVDKGSLIELQLINCSNSCTPTDESIDAFMAVITSFPARFMGGQPLVEAVYMRRAKPDDITPYIDVFGENIHFDSPNNIIVYCHQALLTRLPNYSAQLTTLCDDNLKQYRIKTGQASFQDRVYQAILKNIVAASLSQLSVAAELNVSISSLQKQLRHDNKNYQYILDSVRKNVAKEYLQSNTMSIVQVAEHLGFTSSSNFSRAFKRWLGVSPATYRKQFIDK